MTRTDDGISLHAESTGQLEKMDGSVVNPGDLHGRVLPVNEVDFDRRWHR